METKFNFKSQIATSREQSARLLALGLKKETADIVLLKEMVYDEENHCTRDGDNYLIRPIDYLEGEEHRGHIPAWSLHRLLLLIPKEVNIDGYRFPSRFDAVLRMEEEDDMYEYLIGVLERTIKAGYFNKEYLENGN